MTDELAEAERRARTHAEFLHLPGQDPLMLSVLLAEYDRRGQGADLMPIAEAAAHLGKTQSAARKLLYRYGIREQRGYPRQQVLGLEPIGRGTRTDLRKDTRT